MKNCANTIKTVFIGKGLAKGSSELRIKPVEKYAN
jgi:hypothetical protein